MPMRDATDDLDPGIVDAAIEWAVRLRSGTAGEAERRACAAWRAEHPEHERAWQRLEAVEAEFTPVAGPLGGRVRTSLERVRGRRRRRLAVGLLGLGAVALLASVLEPMQAWQRLQADHVTAVGERRSLTLADGTVLQLDSNTVIDIDRSGDQRLVRVYNGAVLVATAAGSSAAPVEIRTGQARFEPVGTRFAVRTGDDASRLHVAAGRVRITPREADGPALVAHAGETHRVDRAVARLVPPPAIDPAAWAEGHLLVRRARLHELLEEFGRYHRGWLLADPAVADLRVSGIFRLDDIDAALDALAESLPVTLTRRTRYWVTVTPDR